MSAHAVTLQLPHSLYTHFKSRAKRTKRSMESELLEAVATVAEDEEKLPQDLTEAVAGLEVLDDAALWNAARTRLSEESRERLEALSSKQQSEGLTRTERESLQGLLHQCDRTMLVRAHAVRLLKERGHEVSALLAG